VSEYTQNQSERRSSQLPGGSFDERTLPPQARLVRGATDPGVWAAAVNMHNNVIDPRTGTTWHDQDLATVATATFHRATADCLTLAVERSGGAEDAAQEHAERARGHADVAVDRIENIGTLLEDLYEGPSGALITGQALLLEHQAAQELATRRERDGDTRHLESRFEHAWVVTAVLVFALLDLILLWRPLLGLGFRQDAGTVIRWCVGLGLAAAQSLFIESAVRLYQRAERACRDRRDARSDYNRTVRTTGGNGAEPPPELGDVLAADDRLVRMERVVAAAATFTGVICAVRVAILGRETALPMIEAGVFAAIVGLVLGGLILLLAWLSQRGNQLGDRLPRGAAAVAELEADLQAAREAIADCRERAWAELSASETSSTAAMSAREAVANDYWTAELLACGWLGYDSASLSRPEMADCQIPLARLTGQLRRAIENRLGAIDQWLADRPNIRATTLTTAAAITAGAAAGTAPLPSIAPPPMRTVIVYPPEIELLPEPRAPHLLVLAGAALTVAAAVVAAVYAPTPGGDSGPLAAPHAQHIAAAHHTTPRISLPVRPRR
jgi:hypothetical protein